MNSSQSTQAAQAGNRITFTSQTLPNGTINIGSHSGGGPTIISTSQLPNTTTIKTITAGAPGQQPHAGLPHQVQVQHHQILQSGGGGGGTVQSTTNHTGGQQQSVGATQTQTLVIKSNHAVTLPAGLVSNTPGIVTMTKTLQQQGNQPIINSMIPASVVVGMRPNTQQQPKNIQGNTLSRVVIGGPHMVGTRPQSPAITLSTINPGQTPALLLKTESGFQLLRVGTATSGPVTQTIGTNSTNPTQIRLQTVPAASMSNAGTTANNIVVNSVASTNSVGTAPGHVFTSQANISLQQPTATTNLVATAQQNHQQHTQQQAHQQFHQQTQHLQAQPQITQIQTITATAAAGGGSTPNHLQPQQQQQHQTNANNNTVNSSNNSNSIVSSTTPALSSTTSTPPNTVAQSNTKEKCRKFLANLIDLSTREPKPVEKNVRSLIQELVNANVEPEDFCDRLERLLNASPQPCLIGFLKKSLPLLRQALFTKELIIEGIKPPPQHAVTGLASIQQQFSKIQAQIRPISQNQTTTIGQTQLRMISPVSAARPIGHTTITKQPCNSSIRLQAPVNGPRLLNTQIRGPVQSQPHQQQLSLPQQQQQQQQPQSQPTNAITPQLQNSVPHTNIVQIRGPSVAQINRPATVQIRTAKGKNVTTTTAPGAATTGIAHVKVGQTQIKAISSTSVSATANVIAATSPAIVTQPPSLVAISNNVPTASNISSSASILSTINSVATNSSGDGHNLPIPSLPTVQLPPSILAQQQQQQQQQQHQLQQQQQQQQHHHQHQHHQQLQQLPQQKSAVASIVTSNIGINGSNSNINSNNNSTTTSIIDTAKLQDIKGDIKLLASVQVMPQHSATLTVGTAAATILATATTTAAATITLPTISNVNRSLNKSTSAVSKAAAKKKKEQADKERDEMKLNNSSTASNAAVSFFRQPSISMSSYGDDDINDVAAMGGVNLAEETQRILGCTEYIGTQIRSCKDEVFLHLPALQARIRAMVMERGLEEPSQDVAVLISHACQERLKNIVEKLAVIAEHRIDVIKLDPRYEVTKDVRSQIKFLEELDKAEQKRHEELEREMLLRAAKSRSKIEDPEQAKMKARAKEMQRAELEELRQRDANMTALQAIGPRKKQKIDNDSTSSSGAGTSIYPAMGVTGTSVAPLRPRIKRVNLRDMLFFMEQERETCRSQMLYKAYLK